MRVDTEIIIPEVEGVLLANGDWIDVELGTFRLGFYAYWLSTAYGSAVQASGVSAISPLAYSFIRPGVEGRITGPLTAVIAVRHNDRAYEDELSSPSGSATVPSGCG